jgi:hypothetical protein
LSKNIIKDKIESDMEDIKLYSEIEHLIIAWNIDGTKTAGYLTREIMGLINQRKIYKEQQELLESAYNNFIYYPDYKGKCYADLIGSQAGQLVKCPTQEDFIDKCKTDIKFSEKWGLKIEERDLSFEERHMIWHDDNKKANVSPFMEKQLSSMLDEINIPTKLITMTYNDIKLERYE